MAASRIALKEFKSPPPIERAFHALARDERPFFLDTGLRLPGFGRFSLLGSQPFLVLESKGTRLTRRGIGRPETQKGNPFRFLKETVERFKLSAHPPLPFAAGAVGYLGYDLCHFIERVPATATDDLGVPDMVLGFYDTALVADHQTGRAWVAAADLGVPGRANAERRAAELFERVASCSGVCPEPAAPRHSTAPEIACNFTRSDYLRAIERAKEYIAAGDIFQVNLSRRF